jgi:nicotinate-nucleotide adenylyltransferase
MSHILLYGGSFSPPTKGHQKFAKGLSNSLTELGYDELWILPCYASFTGKTLANPKHRSQMCELAFGHLPNTKVCNFEIINKLHMESADVAELIIKSHKDTTFGFAIGVDSANTFHEWNGHEKLAEMMNFIVVERKGYESVKNAWYHHLPHRFISLNIPEVSSTAYRKYKKEGNVIEMRKILSDDVFEYIEKNHLFI